jgi:hypothetical protein
VIAVTAVSAAMPVMFVAMPVPLIPIFIHAYVFFATGGHEYNEPQYERR